MDKKDKIFIIKWFIFGLFCEPCAYYRSVNKLKTMTYTITILALKMSLIQVSPRQVPVMSLSEKMKNFINQYLKKSYSTFTTQQGTVIDLMF